MFTSNLELALSVILKQWEIYESKHVVVECRCLKTCYPFWYAPQSYSQFHNILRIFDVLPNFSFTTSETIGDYYL